jgi:hypothetical protein
MGYLPSPTLENEISFLPKSSFRNMETGPLPKGAGIYVGTGMVGNEPGNWGHTVERK